ncbi:MAG: porin [Burkholderiaceae bacterium]|jgi:predicted porin|nr:porin [Burkholderiaceae bacterium]
MKKTLIALAVLGTTAGVACAQSNVQIYGVIDTGYVKETGTDARMGSSTESRIGFKGSEDLGRGLKATFELERRFNVNDGSLSTNDGIATRSSYHAYDAIHGLNADWKGVANVGLAGNWGKVKVGRVNNIATESYSRLDPFGDYSVGASLTAAGNLLYSEQLSNTIRYDSPTWAGFQFGLSFTTQSDDHQITRPIATPADRLKSIANHGYNINLQYENGPLLLLGNYYRLADSDSSDGWNLGMAYTFGTVTVSLGYQDTDIESGLTRVYGGLNPLLGGGPKSQKEGILGLQWQIGPGQLNASYNYAKYESVTTDDKAHKFALGYTYNLSKRTSVYGMASYTDSDNEEIGGIYNTSHTGRESSTAFQLGMNHKF